MLTILLLVSSITLNCSLHCNAFEPLACGSNLTVAAYDEDEDDDDDPPSDAYVPETFMDTYFFHLINNKPRNKLGICGYTAISMLLSYYDSYWNDAFIDESQDSHYDTINYSDLYSYIPYAYNSPGVYNNISVSAPSIDDIKNSLIQAGLVEGTGSYYDALDWALMQRVYNQIESQTFLGTLFQIAISNHIIPVRRYPDGTMFNQFLYTTSLGLLHSQYVTILNAYIDQNVKLSGHVTLDESAMITTDPYNSYYLTEKQRIRNEIIGVLQTGRPVIVGGNIWNDSNSNNIVDDGEIKSHAVIAYDYDSNSDTIYGHYGYTFDKTHSDIELKLNYCLTHYIALDIDDIPQKITDNYYLADKTAYYSPIYNKVFNIIHPTDFGFPDAYNQNQLSSVLTVGAPLSNITNETVTVKRVRTGFIQNECINLSTKRMAPGIAYLEMTFPREVKSLTIDISWWSNNEMVSSQNSQYYIQGFDGGFCYNFADIWYEGISTDRTHPTKLTVDFEQGVYTIRFYGSTTDYINDRNKGRLSLFDMMIEYWDLSI